MYFIGENGSSQLSVHSSTQPDRSSEKGVLFQLGFLFNTAQKNQEIWFCRCIFKFYCGLKTEFFLI